MKTILLIDDEESVRTMFGQVLRRGGYNVIEADTGSSGLEIARRHLPDLILSDIHMPGGDGSTLLRDIRHDPELRARQVVLMTGKPEQVTPRKGMEEGADDFLVKPVSMDALLGCVKARLNRASFSWKVEDDMLAQLHSSVPAQLPHEFFTPLAGIIGLMEILRAESLGLAPEEVRNIHTEIYQSALRLHRTLRKFVLLLDLQSTSIEFLVGSLSPRQVEESIRTGVTEVLRQNRRREDVTIQVDACAPFRETREPRPHR